jgi:hypothetical protein
VPRGQRRLAVRAGRCLVTVLVATTGAGSK